MIIDRYSRPANFPECQTTDPILQELDWILDDPVLFDLVRGDFAQHYKPTRKGRHPIAIEVILRMTVLRRRKKWPYRQAEQEVRDSPTYRGWVHVFNEPVPDHTTLNDLERVIQPKTLHHINDRIVTLAQDHRLTRGYRLRVDSSVTESNIHHPTDSALLYDGVRLLSRWLKRARRLLPARFAGARLCRGHNRSARRRMQQIARWSRASQARQRTSPRGEVKKKRYIKPILSSWPLPAPP
jgi:transposase, IS5 family